MESSPPKKPWRKILYEEQDYPDNYVDKTQFLNGLKKNCKLSNPASEISVNKFVVSCKLASSKRPLILCV